jgi:hypothetical protein
LAEGEIPESMLVAARWAVAGCIPLARRSAEGMLAAGKLPEEGRPAAGPRSHEMAEGKRELRLAAQGSVAVQGILPELPLVAAWNSADTPAQTPREQRSLEVDCKPGCAPVKARTE